MNIGLFWVPTFVEGDSKLNRKAIKQRDLQIWGGHRILLNMI